MEAFGTRMRGTLATLLSAALIMSGALLSAPAASAAEPAAVGSASTEVAPTETFAAEDQAAEDQLAVDTAAGDQAGPATEAPAASESEATADGAVDSAVVDVAAAPNAVDSQAAPFAAAAAPALTATEAPRAGGEITVNGSGYTAAYPGIYIAIGPAGLPGFYMGASSLIETVHVAPENVDGSTESGRTAKMNADGSFSLKFTVPAFEDGTAYSLYTSKAHGQGFADRSQDVIAEVAYAAEPVVAAPSVEVIGSVTDLDPEASNVVTVKGSGFVPNPPATSGARPPLAGKFTGTYVAFGSYASVWQPSTGAAAATRSGVDVKWALPAESMGTVGGAAAGAVELQPDGTFETTLTLTPDESKAVTDGSWGIVTYPGGGAKYAPFETFTPVTFKDASDGATLRATATVTDEGLKVNVDATGLPGAIYAALIERGTASDLDMDDPNSYAAFALPFPTVTDGAASFSLVASMSKLDRKKQYEVIVWKIHSLPDASTIYGESDVTVTDAQWDVLENVTPPVDPPVKPTPPTPGAGSLTWGVSTAFANYVTGNIAKGSVSTSGVGGARGGYVFPQASGGSWNPETRTGTVQYSGTVTYTGHGGLLHETYANPVITVSSPTSGTISVSGQSFPLNLIGASFVANADGSVTWSGVAVNGVISGGDGGGAGGSLGLDSLSFTVGSASSLNFGSTTTTSPFAQQRTAAKTVPSTTGITVVTPADKIVAGGAIEITASGFEPNEQGILVVLYSEPTVLDTNAKADANGVVRWIGKLPKDLTGKHTITLQGSISVGQEINIASTDSVKKLKTQPATLATPKQTQHDVALTETGTPAWIWWTSALALLLVAGTSTGLVVAQRRKQAAAPTHL